MSNEKPETKDNKPSHTVYHVVNYGDDNKKSKWDPIGAAWEHKDGEGFNVELKLFPVDGKLVIRRRKENGEKTQ